jgi:hypothetical protein
MDVKLGPWGIPSTCPFLVILWAGIKIEKGYIPNINTKTESCRGEEGNENLQNI